MKTIKLLLFLIPFVSFSSYSQTDYQNDVSDFFVQDNPTNENLTTVNFFLCILRSMSPDKMVGAGPYVANVFEKQCEEADNSSSDQQKATRSSASSKKDSKGGGSGGNSDSGGGGQSESEENIARSMVVDVTRADANSDQIAEAWVSLPAEQGDDSGGSQGAGSGVNIANGTFEEHMGDGAAGMMPEDFAPPIDVHLKASVTAEPSASLPYGDLTIDFTYVVGADWKHPWMPPSEPGMTKGETAGGGHLDIDESGIKFYEEMPMEPPVKFAAGFIGGDKNKMAGVYTTHGWIYGGADQNKEMEIISQFSLDDTAKVYCSKVLSTYAIDFQNGTPDSNGDIAPTRSPYTPNNSNNWPTVPTAETCFSTAKEDATRNVYMYGVYTNAGARYDLPGEDPFPIKTSVTYMAPGALETDPAVSTERDCYGWADYWGVYSDWECDQINDAVSSQPITNADTVWIKDDGLDASKQYKIEQSSIRLDKVSRTFLPLKDIDGLTFITWMDGDSPEWGAGIRAVGFPNESSEFEGKYTASNDTWTFTKKVSWGNNGMTESNVNISFTSDDWINNVKQTYGSGQSWEYSYVRGLWGWSPDTGDSFDIPEGALADNDPTSRNSTNSIVIMKYDMVTPANFPAELKCIVRCPTGALLNTTYTAALNKVSGMQGTDEVASPYAPETVHYLKSAGGGYQVGDGFDGILASDVVTYTKSGINYVDSANATIQVPTNITDGYSQLEQTYYKPNPHADYWTESTSWGVRPGALVTTNELSKLECPRENPNDNTSAYREVHPVFNASATRYCEEGIYSPTSSLTEWYEMSIGASKWDRQSFAVDQSTSQFVVFSSPKMLWYEVPEDATKYGTDAGKKIRLEFNGHGNLWGIPGEVINTQTGESLGQWVNDWQSHYRYADRFTIEPHNGLDPVLTDIDGNTYKVKALEGEEWLKLKNSAMNTLPYTGLVTEADLPDKSLLKDTSPTGPTNESIGAKPTDDLLLNGGKPSVIHGDVINTFETAPSS
ncbi:MAG: hypothetical protein CBC38_06945 [Gammaproteobacteria bacterium TMED78]|nr:MAG: hypothetical protein CBC38_06945 [Gammaproteobacteria bacterium TMED78]|tara:strand:+ start:10613 stop:13627 length:3015 start_codon:yes stop_codon:yes gene_type:complete